MVKLVHMEQRERGGFLGTVVGPEDLIFVIGHLESLLTLTCLTVSLMV